MASLPMSFNNDRPDTPRAPEARAAHQEDMNVEASLRDLTQRVAALIDEREAVDEELKRVKRKYRRATTDAQTAKNEVAQGSLVVRHRCFKPGTFPENFVI